jgi:hypothetical protein
VRCLREAYETALAKYPDDIDEAVAEGVQLGWNACARFLTNRGLRRMVGQP